MNSQYGEVRAAIGRRFNDVSTTRSQATRKGSAELYVIARGFRGGVKSA
jgi:23S rRNA U2552 (ribose-2'-O)-methylase RlmE/FtsJ